MPRYLGLEEELPGLVIDEVTRRYSIPSLLIEGGQHDDPGSIDVHEACLWALLSTMGSTDDAQAYLGKDPIAMLAQLSSDTRNRVYDLRQRIGITHADFQVERGIESGVPVYAGRTVVAHQGNEAVKAQATGEAFLPNMQPIKRVGDDGLFIVRRVGGVWVSLSGIIRDWSLLHALLVRCPGVHQLESGALLVDADLAAVMKRQVFHLLGYRLLKHDQRESGYGLGRVFKGIRAFFRAAITRQRVHEISDDDPRFWTVKRRTLDVDRRAH